MSKVFEALVHGAVGLKGQLVERDGGSVSIKVGNDVYTVPEASIHNLEAVGHAAGATVTLQVEANTRIVRSNVVTVGQEGPNDGVALFARTSARRAPRLRRGPYEPTECSFCADCTECSYCV